MCVIIYLPAGKNITKQDLKDAWDCNPDGAGIAYLKNNKIHVRKGFMDWGFFYESCKDIIFDDSLERILHLRITSRGKTSAEQTHPFPLSNDNVDFGILEYTTTTPVLMMNGTLKIGVEDGLNDTATWIKQELYKYNYQLPRLYKVLNKNHCRWAIISASKIVVTDDFIEDDGVYYSNLNHQWFSWFKPSEKSKSKKSKSYHGDWRDSYSHEWDLWTSDDWADFVEDYAWYDPEHDYDTDENCNKCFLWGRDCYRCFIYDEAYADYETYTKDYSQSTTVYEITSSEAK